MSKFLSMGGYALYVWSAYGVTLLLLAIPVIKTCYLMKKTKKHAPTL